MLDRTARGIELVTKMTLLKPREQHEHRCLHISTQRYRYMSAAVFGICIVLGHFSIVNAKGSIPWTTTNNANSAPVQSAPAPIAPAPPSPSSGSDVIDPVTSGGTSDLIQAPAIANGNDLLDVSGTDLETSGADCIPTLDLLAQKGGFNVLINAVRATGLENLFNSERAVRTILAPNDDAFIDLLRTAGIRESELLAEEDKLRKILLNHVILGEQVQLDEFVVGRSYPTANTGEVLTAVAPVDPFVTESNILACNTLIQAIDIVLIPEYVKPLGSLTIASESDIIPAPANPAPASVPAAPSSTSGSVEIVAASASGTGLNNFEFDAKAVDVNFG